MNGLIKEAKVMRDRYVDTFSFYMFSFVGANHLVSNDSPSSLCGDEAG